MLLCGYRHYIVFVIFLFGETVENTKTMSTDLLKEKSFSLYGVIDFYNRNNNEDNTTDMFHIKILAKSPSYLLVTSILG